MHILSVVFLKMYLQWPQHQTIKCVILFSGSRSARGSASVMIPGSPMLCLWRGNGLDFAAVDFFVFPRFPLPYTLVPKRTQDTPPPLPFSLVMNVVVGI